MGRKQKDQIINTGDDATQPIVESKAEKFARLAPRRVDDAVRKINRVGKLAAKGSYEYTPEQVEKIIMALGDALAAASKAFEGGKAKAAGFTF